MDTKRIMSVLLAVVLAANVAQATITTSLEWNEDVIITDGDTIQYYNENSWTWTLNNSTNVTYSGPADASLGHCVLGYQYNAPVTGILTIQTTVGNPGVLNFVGNINKDPDLGIRLGHSDDVGILNIENGNTLLINAINKYITSTPVPSDRAIVNINDGHLFCYTSVDDRRMTGITVTIAEGSSMRIIADIANVYNQATYAVYTTGSDTVAGSVTAGPGAMLQFTDGGNYNDGVNEFQTVLVSAVVPEPATMMLLGLGGFGLFWRKVR